MKADLDKFVRAVQGAERNKSFWHFTDARNVPSIKQYGILSLQALDLLGIKVSAPGGNPLSHSLDKANGMDRYVHLCLDSDHPMEFAAKQDGRIESCQWLRIEPSIIKDPGVLVTADVANKNGIVPSKPEDLLGTLDLEVIYTRMNWSDSAIQTRLQAARRYEILVPDAVLTKYIMF